MKNNKTVGCKSVAVRRRKTEEGDGKEEESHAFRVEVLESQYV